MATTPPTEQHISNPNLGDFNDGVSDLDALALLLNHGAQIRGVRNLHAKLYLFGESRVLLTSANLTETALQRNHEFGFVSEEESIILPCREYFDDLWRRAGKDLKLEQLQAWQQRLPATQLEELDWPGLPPGQTEGVPT